jgi:hypothetical protein
MYSGQRPGHIVSPDKQASQPGHARYQEESTASGPGTWSACHSLNSRYEFDAEQD